jgi:sortase (surface protein transpeptidase)
MENSNAALSWRIKPAKRVPVSVDGFAVTPRRTYTPARSNYSLPRQFDFASQPVATPRPVATEDVRQPLNVETNYYVQPLSRTVLGSVFASLRQSIDVLARARQRVPLRYITVVIILSVTGALAINTWQTNEYVQKVAAQPQATPDISADTPASSTETAIPSEAPVAPKAVKAYAVAPDLPRTITIKKLGLRARVLQLGVLANGEMATPSNTNDTGWYTGSARPGERGAAIINGHVSGLTRGGVFLGIKKLTAGDKIAVTKGNGEILTYEVRATEAVPAGQLDMSKLFNVYEGKDEGLNLITCAGTYNRSTKSFDQRTVVYTVRVP